MKILSATFVKSSSNYSQCPEATLPEFAFVGRSNVGKSSLINMLTGQKGLAKTSSTPGKTQTINHFIINQEWYLVDMPGYGFAKTSKASRAEWITLVRDYILNRKTLANLFLLIDSRHEPLKNDLEFISWLGSNGVPFSLVFTKIDKLTSTQLNKNMNIYKKQLEKEWEALPPIYSTSTVRNYGLQELLNYIDYIFDKIKQQQ